MKKSMLTRIIVGLVLVGLFIFIWFLPGIPQTIAFTLMSLLCVYEMRRTFKAKELNPPIIPAYVFAAAVSAIITYLPDKPEYIFMLLFACVVATILIRIFKKSMTNSDMFAGLAVYAYPLIPITVMIHLCSVGSVEITRLATLALFAIPLVGDTFAYFVGVTIGKHKLCEHISPKKTIEGSIGGMIGGVCGGLIAYFMKDVIVSIWHTAPIIADIKWFLIFGFVGGIVGQIGDLFASCIKRWAGVKDYGNIFPGHGGMLDRIDSVIFCAPIIMFMMALAL